MRKRLEKPLADARAARDALEEEVGAARVRAEQ
jgi:hypothetical protein